jgi:hypothetical protein
LLSPIQADPTWDETFDLDVSGGAIDLELWENPPWEESGWWNKLLGSTEMTEVYARKELFAQLHISLTDINPPFPEKDTPHRQAFLLQPVGSKKPIDTKARLQLEFTPINFGSQPSIGIRKFLDTTHVPSLPVATIG